MRILAGALASAVLLPSGSCHWSFHSDPDGRDPKKSPCPPNQPALGSGAPELPLEAYRILGGNFAPLPDGLPWAGWSLEAIEGPPPLGPHGGSDSCRAHREFAGRLAAANPSLVGSGAVLEACGADEAGTWALLAIGDPCATVTLAFDDGGRLARLERR